MNETSSQPENDDLRDAQTETRDAAQEATDQAYESFEAAQDDAAPETRDEEMIRLRSEVEAADKRVLQAQAEAENFRKRMRRDYEDQLKFAAMPLVNDILQVRDNLTRAIEAASASGGVEAAEGLREGVAMVAKQLDDTLGKYGVEPIPADGEEFDPNFHEAISQMPHPEIESGKVAHVAVSGFKMHGRVIRPAQVVVSTGTP
ncbi:nucleotide exchange factor GrpE [Rhodopirellula sp. SWK7]|uniref:nucleotide exchange factor GrpE n=1 Tax=Rhodopirellula sp. SWK7 TaxID=595460 RepID=UPI0002C029D6|nr:nucleotide exchange factor GrpE [Rhodopirellula sp. SWK7]EMI43989.1 GrpE nucleotide exchange factor [Rhodopirellula sp. SWK7]